ncbi:MAG: ROK family protein [Oscillospiraceae bacterium]|nr:ROK family protein [Oscillospiraceae bacterium]
MQHVTEFVGGVDFGASHLGFVVTDGKGNVLYRKFVDVEFDDYSDVKGPGGLSEKEAAIFNTMMGLIQGYEDNNVKSRITDLTIGVPGVPIGTNILSFANLPGIKDFDIGIPFRNNFTNMGLRSETAIHVINDGVANASFEMVAEVGQLQGVEFGAIYGLGSGLATSLILYGKIRRSEGGHVIINFQADMEADKCGCPLYGCSEVYSSVKTLRQRISRLFGLRVSKNKETDQTIFAVKT